VAIAAVSVFGLAIAGAAAAGTDIGRYKFFAFLVPLYTRLKKDSVLDHFERGRIFEYIGKNPGAHYSEIHLNLDLNNGALAYHLKVLEREGYIGSRSFGMYKRFFPSGYKIPESDFVSIQELLVRLVTERPGIGLRDMASELGVARSTINYHCNLLVRSGRIEYRKLGPKKSYWPK
jgi:predicted transcriptional regulator